MSSKRKRSEDSSLPKESSSSTDDSSSTLLRTSSHNTRQRRRLQDDSDAEQSSEQNKDATSLNAVASNEVTPSTPKDVRSRGRPKKDTPASKTKKARSSTTAAATAAATTTTTTPATKAATKEPVEYKVPINHPSIVTLPAIPVNCYPPVPPSSAEALVDATEGTLNAHGLGTRAEHGELEQISNADIDWSQVGGLNAHLEVQHDMIMMPLQYPWQYDGLGLKPPRGVLFTGPPGTGKTLTARAQAATCSKMVGKSVTFYVRKGADCQSKWVGEAERQLRLLFEEARKNQPSIIFFDEIDGLAPVRTSSQDQVHASIVSTLLALMDGLDSRGQVIVIGATNRVDAIDPALRRPGRFDRELQFSLPSQEARKEILKIHTRKWTTAPTEQELHNLSCQTVGYCGADQASLCTEASLLAIREILPMLRDRSQKTPPTVTVHKDHFALAMTRIVPSSLRNNTSYGSPLPDQQKPLLNPCLDSMIKTLRKVWPEHLKSQSQRNSNQGTQHITPPFLVRPRLILHGGTQHGAGLQTQALAHEQEAFPCYNLQLSSLLGNAHASTLEDSLLNVIREAKRSSPSILVIPDVEVWLQTISETCRVIFTSEVQNMADGQPILVLASFTEDNRDPLLHRLCSKNEGMVEAVTLNSISVDKVQWFKNMLKESVMYCLSQTLQEENNNNNSNTSDENCMTRTATMLLEHDNNNQTDEQKQQADKGVLQQQRKRDEVLLLHLRLFLRSVCSHLMAQFKDFVMATNAEPKHLVIYLRDIQQSINAHKYQSIREFQLDIDLLVASVRTQLNNSTSHGRTLQTRAAQLQDTALVLCLGLDQSIALALEVVAVRLRSQPGGFSPWPGLMFVPDSSLLARRVVNANDKSTVQPAVLAVPPPPQSTSKKNKTKQLFEKKSIIVDAPSENVLASHPQWETICALSDQAVPKIGVDILDVVYAKSRLCRGDLHQV